MTVCIATDGFPPQTGGIAAFNQHLVTLLRQAGHRVVVLYVDYDNRGDDWVQTDDSLILVKLRNSYHKYYSEWKPYFRPGGFDAPNWIAIGLGMQDWLLRHHREYGIEVVEASDYGGAGIFLCHPDLPPLVITGHGSLVQFAPYNNVAGDGSSKVIKELETLSYQYAAAVISHSTVNTKALQQLSQRDISQALPPWHWPEKLFPVTSMQEQIVAAGGLQPVKGVSIAAAAMEKLLTNYQTCQLAWFGGDTWLAPGYGKMSGWLASQYPGSWQKNFVWHGALPHEELLQKMAAASVVIVPALFETFNYVALEAAAMGKALILTRNTGAAEYFTHGKDAWIIEPNDAEALAEAIQQLMKDEALRNQLGHNAPQRMRELFRPEDILAQRMEIYQLSKDRRRPLPEYLIPFPGFLRRYRTAARKYYYCIRRQLKKLAGR